MLTCARVGLCFEAECGTGELSGPGRAPVVQRRDQDEVGGGWLQVTHDEGRYGLCHLPHSGTRVVRLHHLNMLTRQEKI